MIHLSEDNRSVLVQRQERQEHRIGSFYVCVRLEDIDTISTWGEGHGADPDDDMRYCEVATRSGQRIVFFDDLLDDELLESEALITAWHKRMREIEIGPPLRIGDVKRGVE